MKEENTEKKPRLTTRVEILFGRVFLIILSVSIALFVCEAISRKFFIARTAIEIKFPAEHYRYPRPYSMFAGEPGSKYINALGYTGEIPAMPKPKGEYRIFFLGGSTVVSGDPSLPKLVQNILKQKGFLNIKIYNFGIPSSVSGQELARLVFELPDLAPDMIVVYNGGNDIMHPLSWDPRPGYPFNFIVYENHPLITKKLNNYPAAALFAYGSNLMRYFFQDYFMKKFIPLDEARKECNYMSPGWKDKIAEIYVNNIIKAGKISKAFGIEFIAFFQPLLHAKDPEKFSEEEQKLFRSEDNDRFYREVLELTVGKIKSAVNKHNTEFIDLSGIYKNNSAWIFTDPIHTRQDAKNLPAQKIADKIVAKINKSADN